MGSMIQFTRPDNQTAPGYYAAPATGSESAPGIVLVEEWWGVTDDVKRIADQYAGLGYRVLVPDLFRGRTAAVGDEANHLVEGLDFQDAFSQDIRGALAHLKREHATKAGVTGYCMGGALALIAAMHLPEADAAVVYYGMPPAEAGDPATISIPLQCHFATHDEFVKPALVDRLEERLKAGHVRYEIHKYDAHHGFCNPNPLGASGLGHYNEAAAKLSMGRAVQFWQRTLR